MPTRPFPPARPGAAQLRAADQPPLDRVTRPAPRRPHRRHVSGSPFRSAARRLRDPPDRQCGEPRRRDDEGRRQPDGLPGGDRALHAQPQSTQDRARQAAKRRASQRRHIVDFLKTMAIAASGLRAQAGRMRVISENIANADSTPSAPAPIRTGARCDLHLPNWTARSTRAGRRSGGSRPTARTSA